MCLISSAHCMCRVGSDPYQSPQDPRVRVFCKFWQFWVFWVNSLKKEPYFRILLRLLFHLPKATVVQSSWLWGCDTALIACRAARGRKCCACYDAIWQRCAAVRHCAALNETERTEHASFSNGQKMAALSLTALQIRDISCTSMQLEAEL